MPLWSKKGEHEVPVNFGWHLSVDVSAHSSFPKDSLLAGSGFSQVPLIVDKSGFTATDSAARSWTEEERPSLRPCSPPRQCMLPEDQHGTCASCPQPPAAPCLSPLTTLWCLAALANCSHSLLEGPWWDFASFCFVCLKLKLVIFFCWTVFNRAGCWVIC